MASPDASDDLTRALQGLNAGDEPGEKPGSAEPGDAPQEPADADPGSIAEHLEAEAGEEAVGEEQAAEFLSEEPEADAAPVPRRPYKAPPPTVNVKSRKVLIQVVYGLAVLMLIPAVWAAALLMGLHVPMSGRSSADSMAKVMLLAWPMSVMMFAFAGWLTWDLKRVQASIARRAAAAAKR